LGSEDNAIRGGLDMARMRKPSYRKAIGSWVRFKTTGRGIALRHPVRATFKARRYIRRRQLKRLTGMS